MNDIKRLVQEAEDQGWRLRKRGRHLVLLSPLGRGIVVIPRSSGDWRNFQNTLRYLRQFGFTE
jgi:hypothetical protein